MGKCPKCPPGSPDQPLIGGMCQRHYWQNHRGQAKGVTSDDMDRWFDEMIEKVLMPNPHCWECGERIPSDFYRCAIAHVLPKKRSQFPSVRTHPMNRMILGSGCGCHNRYDKSWHDAMQMKVWPIAVSLFLEIYPYINEEEKKKLPECLTREL